MPQQREEILNGKLAELLIARHPRWSEANVFADSTQVILGHHDWKVDVLIAAEGQPVAIEAKRETAAVDQLDTQIRERLGEVVEKTNDIIESGVTLVYPKGASAGILAECEFKYAIYRDDGRTITRWPEAGWIAGSIDDLSTVVETIALSERRIRLGEQTLEQGVSANAEILTRDAAGLTVLSDLGKVLHQQQGPQTTRMAIAILANAFVFHYAIEGIKGIPPVDYGRGAAGFLRSKVLDGWKKILDVNYWPIFSIARAILETVPARLSNPLLTRLHRMAEELLNIGAVTFHDLAGRMFQTLITDRKFLATFYTLPTSAALLAEAAVARLDVDWSDTDAIAGLRIADFACGTGALLSAVQRALYRRHRRAGGDDATIHRRVMEQVLLGTDIMPAATHLTANVLSSAHPGTGYGRSLVQVLPYGLDPQLAGAQKLPEDTVYIGALDLLGDEFIGDLLGEWGIELGGKRMLGMQSVAEGELPVRHHSFDLVIMNPPFTRPNANRPRTDVGVPIPSFAGFDTSKAEQWAMASKLRSYPSRFAFGHAGLAANFMDLAHAKLKPGGVLALVLPATFVSGRSWRKARSELQQYYCDIDVLSISATGVTRTAFSADTDIAECLVIARKKSTACRGRAKVGYFNFRNRPESLVEAQQMVAQVLRRTNVITGTISDSGLAQLASGEIGEAMGAFAKGSLKLPRAKPIPLRIATVGELARPGLDSQMVNGNRQNGPFVIKIESPQRQTYKALWSHHASVADGDRERRLLVSPDAYGLVRDGMEERAIKIWRRTASRLHANRDFRLNSQSLAMCVTDEPTIGGRAWPSLKPFVERFTWPLVLWANSTLGIIAFWWIGNRQQEGRASLTLTKLPRLLTLDARELTTEQNRTARRLFEDFSERPFLPAHEAHHDSTRQDLDAALFDMVGLPSRLLSNLATLRDQWCAEPTVRGSKGAIEEGGQ